jgi:hypothetical protein
MTDSSSSRQWILLLSLTALLLSLAVLAQIASRYASAYLAAPREVSAFVDAVDSSIAENESYDRDVSKVQRLEDKLRLGRLLRDIQRGGDELRELINTLFAEGPTGETDKDESSSRPLRTVARVFWASKRLELEDKVRRLDLLRMRFLVVHMGIIAGVATEAAAKQQQSISISGPEKHVLCRSEPRPGALPRSVSDSIKSGKLPLRRLSTQAIGHQENTEGSHRRGWVGVVQELQKSPLLQKRHASIETAMKPRIPCTP